MQKKNCIGYSHKTFALLRNFWNIVDFAPKKFYNIGYWSLSPFLGLEDSENSSTKKKVAEVENSPIWPRVIWDSSKQPRFVHGTEKAK